MATAAEEALLTGLLVGEGHFGGDGRQPQVTLRMHLRHEDLFRWIDRTFPGGRLYGPYHHGGRDYFQWMARGRFLRDDLFPLLVRWLTPELDGYSFGRFREMCERYGIGGATDDGGGAPEAGAAPPQGEPQGRPSGTTRGPLPASLDAIFAGLRGALPDGAS